MAEELAYSQAFFLTKLSAIAEKYFKDKDYPNALLCYTSIFKYTHSDINIIKNYIKCLDELEQFDLEIELVEFLESLDTENIAVYKLLGEIYNKKNDNYKSVEYMEKYIGLKNSDITSSEYNLLGCYYNKLY